VKTTEGCPYDDATNAPPPERGFEARFAQWVIRYRWPLIVITLLLVFCAASGLRFLTFNNDTRVFFSEDNPQLSAFEALESTYKSMGANSIASACQVPGL